MIIYRYGEINQSHGSVVGFQGVPAIEVFLDQNGQLNGDWLR